MQVAIDFKLPMHSPEVSATRPGGVVGGVPGGVIGGVTGGVIGGVRQLPSAPVAESGRLARIQFNGMTAPLIEALTGRIPVRNGDEIQADTLSRVRQAVQEVDEHLDVRLSRSMNTEGQWEYALQVVSTAQMETHVSSGSPRRIRVGANVQQANLIYSPKPVYPPLAKQARIQGVVRLNAVVSKEGTVENLDAASGHPLLVPAALDAVRQWVYRPTLLNGEPVEVVTVVDVNFTLLE